MKEEELAILDSCLGPSEGLRPVLPFYHRGKTKGMIERGIKLMEGHFGTHTIDKPDVAAHEAGHAVITRLVGFRVKNVAVWIESGNQWAGNVEVDDSKVRGLGDVWLWSEALGRIAGYAGERLVGKDHPSTVVHEKLHCLAICRYFDELRNVPGHFTRALDQCEEALEANREVFEEISYRLLATNRVSGAEILDLMEGAVPLPQNFYEGNHEPAIDIHA